MTPEEIHAMWARWAHRSDLSADLAVIETLAQQRIRDRMMFYADIFAPLEGEADEAAAVARTMLEAPALWCSAGLIEIFRLADDMEQMSREATIFEGAASDYIMRVALRRGPAHAKRSYPDGN